MEQKTIELPEEIYSGSSESYEGENYKVTIKGDTAYVWVNTGIVTAGIDLMIDISLRGSLPVACCAAEMDVRQIPLITPETVIEIKSVQRSKGIVRLVFRKSTDSNLTIAIGIVFTIES